MGLVSVFQKAQLTSHIRIYNASSKREPAHTAFTKLVEPQSSASKGLEFLAKPFGKD